jgi:predicted transcriptional regulator
MIRTNARSSTDIVAEILKAAQDSGGNGITKPQLMYKAFLSFEELNKYLKVLVDNRLLNHGDGSEQSFRVTEKGIKFLNMYEKVIEYVSVMPEV